MKNKTYLFSGLVLIMAGTIGLLAMGGFGYGRTGMFDGMMGRGMMMDGGMGRGMMGGRGMMWDMMRNMEEMEKKTEFFSDGESIFFRGMDLKGEIIKNSHGMQGVGCAFCHGADGNGMRMMMMDVPPLKWSYLADPKGHIHSSGRKHPPFTESSFKTSVIAGVDPAGNKLSTMMPTWEMSDEELNDLIEYLKTL